MFCTGEPFPALPVPYACLLALFPPCCLSTHLNYRFTSRNITKKRKGGLCLKRPTYQQRLTSTHTSSGGPAARSKRRECGEDTSRSGKGLRPLHPCLMSDLSNTGCSSSSLLGARGEPR